MICGHPLAFVLSEKTPFYPVPCCAHNEGVRVAKLPYIPFYPNDWVSDPVAGCSLSAQGLWLRMMFLMHASARYGYLEQNSKPMPLETVARRCGCSEAELVAYLSELDDAQVPSRTNEGIIYSRRMVRDAAKRRKAASFGKKGGNPDLCKKEAVGVNPPVNPRLNMNMKLGLGLEGEGPEGGVPPPFDRPDFFQAWRDWREHLRQAGIRTTAAATKQQLAQCVAWGPERAIAALRHSIAGNCKGLYPAKASTNGKPTRDEDIKAALKARHKS